MTFEELLDQVLAMLQRRGRVSYRTLTRQFALDEADLEDLKEAILFTHPQVVDEAGRGLVWTGEAGAMPLPAPDSPQPLEQPGTPISGEAGIGKSRLVQVLQEHVASEPQAWLTPCQCSLYYQNTALYPLIDLLERVALGFEREESPVQKLRKLEGFLVQYGLPLAEAVPLFAALLSLPLTADYASLTGSPEQQKQKTLQALLTILLRIATQHPLLFVMEDLHWVDPTTLELLSLLVDQGPTARMLVLLTCRPDFSPPWTGRALYYDTVLCQLRRDAPAARDQAGAAITVATAQKFALVQALGLIMRGWTLAVQAHSTEGLVQIRQGLDAYRSTGAEYQRPHLLTLLAEASGLLRVEKGIMIVRRSAFWRR